MKLGNQRGVMLVLVSIVSLVLIGISAYVLDLGEAWYARAQAQTAADSGAIAGAMARAVDEPLAATALTANVAAAGANQNPILGVLGAPIVDTSAAACPSYSPVSNGPCVKVDLYRDGTNGSSAFNTIVAGLFGVATHGVRATATAQVWTANGSSCVRPWFIPDFYVDGDGNNTFNSPPDTYSFPGYVSPRDIGMHVVFHPNTSPSAYGQLDVGSGTADITNAIEHCAPARTVEVGKDIATKPGASNGQKLGLDSLEQWDPKKSVANPNGVWFNGQAVEGGCAATQTCACPSTAAQCPYGGTMSPKIIQAALCNPNDPDCNGDPHTTGADGMIHVTSLLSFFIEDYQFQAGELLIYAVLVGSAGEDFGGPYAPGFLTTIKLVQ